jgi:L-threonylcarbamoyladenylate synthase
MNVNDKIAVRVPDNKCILSLLKECKLMIGTSANVSTKKSFVDPKQCEKSITGYDVFLDGGKIQSLGESTIIEIINEEIKILRQGVISDEKIFSLT